ncbi:MAG TPA: hypothetical protein VGI58_00890 [Streptosporangiaceae bacterium]
MGGDLPAAGWGLLGGHATAAGVQPALAKDIGHLQYDKPQFVA